MLSQLFAQFCAQGHLRKKKRAGFMGVSPIPLVRTTGVKSPIPGRKYQDIADPQSCRRSQQFAGWIQMSWQAQYQ